MINWPVTKQGLKIDSFDPRDAYLDTLLGAGVLGIDSATEPIKYDLRPNPQGASLTCVSQAVSTILEWKYKTYHGLELSPWELYVLAGGGKTGSTFRGNLNAGKTTGLCKLQEFDMDWPIPNDWLTEIYKRAEDFFPTSRFKLPGFVRISTNYTTPEYRAETEKKLEDALKTYGPLLVGVAANSSPGNNYYKDGHTRVKSEDNHGVVLGGFTEDRWNICDSLFKSADATGWHNLDKSYEFYSVYAITELPEEWKEVVETHKEDKSEFSVALNHYGKVREYAKEVAVAAELTKGLQGFNNQSVWEAAGNFWTVLINACAYGNYTVTDMFNFLYHWRRTGEYLFNLNKLRK